MFTVIYNNAHMLWSVYLWNFIIDGTTICLVTCMKLIVQMTVVEAFFAGTKLDPCDDISQISEDSVALIIEGIAQNTTGTVFLPEV